MARQSDEERRESRIRSLKMTAEAAIQIGQFLDTKGVEAQAVTVLQGVTALLHHEVAAIKREVKLRNPQRPAKKG